jgi:hypothetical protein
MIHVFDVSDGSNDYRLEHDAERLTWTLVAMIPGGSMSSNPFGLNTEKTEHYVD